MQPSPTPKETSFIQAISIGSVARRALENDSRGSILGVTSRGIFLQQSNLRVLFLSRETFRGPLTINLPEEAFPEAEVGESVEIHSGRILFLRTAASIDTSDSPLWSAPPIPKAQVSPRQREMRLRKVARGIVLAKDGSGFSALLGNFLEIPSRPALAGIYDDLLPNVRQVKIAIHQGRYGVLPQLLAKFFGLGMGLTPSGDDLIMGLFLCLNRYRAGTLLEQALVELNQLVLKTAYEKTTRLSANLIECAIQGQADERLITAVDGIFCETPSTTDSLNALLTWGHSSGSDALLGIALAVLAAEDQS